MSVNQPRYSMEEFARRGDAIYEKSIKPRLTPDQDGMFVAIDIESGEYEIDADEVTASDRLYARVPDAQPWLRRVGRTSVRRSGRRGISMRSHRVDFARCRS